MDDLRRELAGLRLRLRLQMVVMIGALVVLLFARGGAEVVARALVESDAWTIRTKNVAGTLTARLVATTDVDVARIKVQNANLELAQQPTASLPSTATAGALAYDSTTNTLKYRNTTAWVEAGGAGGLLRAPQVLTAGTSYTPPTGTTAILVIAVGGGGGGGGTANGASTKSGAGGGGGGALVQKYFSSPGACSYSIGAGGGSGPATNGSAGGSTTFTCGAVTITAPGGSGGGVGIGAGLQSATVAPGGAGGSIGTNGDLNAAGGSGGNGVGATTAAGNQASGSGGSTLFGGGGCGNAQPGQGLGAGGSGAQGFGNQAGGSGASGVIIIYEYR